jgi:hypothetical protein
MYECENSDKCRCWHCIDESINDDKREYDKILRDLSGDIYLEKDGTHIGYRKLITCPKKYSNEKFFFSDVEEFDEALDNCYNINDIDEYETTALMAASQIANIDAVIRLLEKHANIHMKDYAGNNALMYASKNDNADTIEILLSNKANIHDINEVGRNALHIACYDDNSNSVNILLVNGANLYDKDYYGSTPEEDANPEIAELLKHWPTLMIIIVLKKLIVYHELDATTLIDIYQYL